jgi:hypothetical protein
LFAALTILNGQAGEACHFLGEFALATQIANQHSSPALRQEARAFSAGASQSDHQYFFAAQLHA